MLLPNKTRELNILVKSNRFNPNEKIYAWNGLTGMVEPYPCQIHPRNNEIERHNLWDIYPYINETDCPIVNKNANSISNRRLATTKEEAWFYYQMELEQQMEQTAKRLENLKIKRDHAAKQQNHPISANDSQKQAQFVHLITLFQDATTPNVYGQIQRQGEKERLFNKYCAQFMESYFIEKQDIIQLCNEYCEKGDIAWEKLKI